MADLVAIAHSDSTNDGSGAATLLEPPQVDNALNDAIIIKVTQSLNNATQVNNINVTTPAGYTLLTSLRDAELKSWVYYKQSTGSETIPTVTSDTVAKWSCTTAIVTDVDWINGGVNQHVQNTGGGDQQSLDLTTSANGNASAIVCLYSLERRTCQGFRYPQTRPQTVFGGTASTGALEGEDNATAAGYDFISDRSTSWEGPFWEANGGADSLAINIEIIVQGNIVPLQSATYVEQRAPANSLNTNMNWCRDIIDGGKDLDGNTLTIWTFDASSDIDTVNDTIAIAGHGMDESMVIHIARNGNTLPGGISNDTFYYAFPQSANTIKLCTVNEDTDATTDYYYDGATQRPVVNITSAGSGSITITEARMINAGQGPLDIFRPNNGNSSNPGPAPGNYIGDGGYNQNFISTAQRFSSTFDATNETITFELQVNSSGRIDRVLFTLIDNNGNWMNWKLYQAQVSGSNTGQLIYQFQVDQASVKALKYQESGTFDHTIIRYLVISGRGNNSTTVRFPAINSASSVVNLGGSFTAVGGQNANFSELVSLAQTYASSISKPSDLQVVSTIPIALGNGSTDISFTDSEKSIAFPPLADGVNTFQNYLDSLGVSINATANSTVKLQNSQIGASVPYSFDISAATGATIDLTGNSYVFATASLDSDTAYSRQLFVGGQGIKDNGAEIRNSTFIVNSQLAANSAMIDWNSNTDIESSSFELAAGTTAGHAIKITAPGSYTFTNLSFTGFGADASNTAAIFNDSGGAVTINVFENTAPTVKNGTSATTTVSVLTVLTLTGIQANSEVRVYDAGTTTELAGVENSSTSFTANISASSVDIVVHSLGYEYLKIEGADTSSNLTLPIQQRPDRNYRNP